MRDQYDVAHLIPHNPGELRAVARPVEGGDVATLEPSLRVALLRRRGAPVAATFP